MTLKLWTSSQAVSKKNKNWPVLDITARGKSDKTSGLGALFAPDWSYVRAHQTGKITDEQYTHLYHQDMLKSYHANTQAWLEVLNMQELILVCFCRPDKFCHRHLLVQYLIKLGAIYQGELI